jgi:hypothetical protein
MASIAPFRKPHSEGRFRETGAKTGALANYSFLGIRTSIEIGGF